MFLLYELTEYCPPGWRGTKTVCLKTIESSSAINYAQAVAACQDPSNGDPLAYPMEPYNDYLNNELKAELSNTSLTETAFWIGKKKQPKYLMLFCVCEMYPNNESSIIKS